MKIIYKISFILIVLMFISCETTSPDELDDNEIRHILDSIQINFSYNDIDSIMQYYDPLFMHNGNDFDWEQNIWIIRINDYDVLSFENIEIIIEGDFATAYFTMSLNDLVTEEPSEENGDISYFYRQFGGWKLCGRDFSFEPLPN
ncbi:MAG: hypothetical protein K9N07_05325 [Candidatus Cloacimonetes bacterium]|nr:hypothetical protein [Candidatus Cloacimonadota bacterium]